MTITPEIIKELLHKRKMKVVQLAKLLEISPSQASLYVHGWVKVPEKHQEKIRELLNQEEHPKYKDKRILGAISSERYEEIKIIFKALEQISETAKDLKAAIYERAYDQTLSEIRDFDSVQDYVREMHNLTSHILDKLQCELKWLE